MADRDNAFLKVNTYNKDNLIDINLSILTFFHKDNINEILTHVVGMSDTRI